MLIEIVGGIGLIAFAIASVTIALRCLALGARSGGLPEFSIGFGFLIGAVVGYLPETIVLSTDWFNYAIEIMVLSVTQVAIRFASISMIIFTLSVFRPTEWWARAGAAIIVAALVVSWVMFPLTRVYAESRADVIWYDVFAIARSLPLLWGAVEALLHYRKAKRQCRLGLSNPIVANRFLLWGVGLGVMTLLMASTIFASLFGVDPAASHWVAAESLAGLTGAIALWLTFSPTRGYLVRFGAPASST